jgi:glycosyltransferase involved in cell wall biosynthesis
MHIAVIVPAFNVAPFISDCILSVLRQTHADWFMVVVDDGSSDATGVVASGFCDERIRLVRQDNAGVSAARNTGIATALSLPDPSRPVDAFVFLDADDWLGEDALAELTRALCRRPRAVAACGRYARVTGRGAVHLSPRSPGGYLLERLLASNLFANGGHLLIRRHAVGAAGGFRQDLQYGEDWEFWTRVALLGEFVSAPTRRPVLFVRERPGSAYLSHATDPDASRPALDAIYRNPDIAERMGGSRLADLQIRASAETAWTVGRELIRHGRQRDGRRWLGHSLRGAPTLKRLLLIILSWPRLGPFRPYGTAGGAGHVSTISAL